MRSISHQHQPLNLNKIILPGTYRYLGQRVAGIFPRDIPIGLSSIRSTVRSFGGVAYRIGRINPVNAFVLERPPLRLLYVRPNYSGYRYAGKKVFPTVPWTADFDHALARNLAIQLGFTYVLLLRVPPSVNRSHGTYERGRPLTPAGLNLAKFCFADRRILDKWLARKPLARRHRSEIQPYSLSSDAEFGLTLKQAGQWAFAMGVDDQTQPCVALSPLRN